MFNLHLKKFKTPDCVNQREFNLSRVVNAVMDQLVTIIL